MSHCVTFVPGWYGCWNIALLSMRIRFPNSLKIRWSSVIILLLATSLGNFVPLTKEENEYRLKSCGIDVKPKVFRGTMVNQSAAPWSVFYSMLNKARTRMELCTGTLVSPRHVLIATHCVAKQNATSHTWWFFESNFNRSNCKEQYAKDFNILDNLSFSDYVISDEELLIRIRISSNNKIVSSFPEKVTLLNACYEREIIPKVKAQYVMDDLAIIDLHEDLVLNDTINMVCVAKDTTANAKGTTMSYFGYGMNPEISGVTTGVLRKETVQVSPETYDIPEYFFLASDPKKNTVACEGDSGGGAIAVISDRLTIVGTLSQSNCGIADLRKTPAELYASIGYYNNDICRLTGICTPDLHHRYHENYVKVSKPPRALTISQATDPGFLYKFWSIILEHYYYIPLVLLILCAIPIIYMYSK